MQQPASPVEPASVSPSPAVPVVPGQAFGANTAAPVSAASIAAVSAIAQTPTTTSSAMVSSDKTNSTASKVVGAPVPAQFPMANSVNGPYVLSNVPSVVPTSVLRADSLPEMPGPSNESDLKQSYESTKESSPLAAAQEINAANPLRGTASPVFSKALPAQSRHSIQTQLLSTNPTHTADSHQLEPRLTGLPNAQAEIVSLTTALSTGNTPLGPVSEPSVSTSREPLTTSGASTNLVPEILTNSAKPALQLGSSASIPSAPTSCSTRIYSQSMNVTPNFSGPMGAPVPLSSLLGSNSSSSGQVQSNDFKATEGFQITNDIYTSATQNAVEAPSNAPQSLTGIVPPVQMIAARPIAPCLSGGMIASAVLAPGRKVNPLGVANSSNAAPVSMQKIMQSQKQERKVQMMPAVSQSLLPISKKNATILSSGTVKKKSSQPPIVKKTAPPPPSLTSLLLKSLGESKSKSGETGVLPATTSQLQSFATKVCVDNISVLGQGGKKEAVAEGSGSNTGASSIREEKKNTTLLGGAPNAGETQPSTLKRARSASEMLEPDETAKSNYSAELGRPVKRLAVENSTSKLPNTSKSKQICLLSISNNSVSATGAGQSTVKRDEPLILGNDKVVPSSTGSNTESHKSILRSSSSKIQIRTGGAAGLPQGRPLLRSSPIAPNATKDTSQADTTAIGTFKSESTVANKESDSNAGESKPARTPRSVSWAPDEKLTQVVDIYNRLDLIKSWDPESEITLPFTQMTLAGLRAHIANEEAQAANPSSNPNSITASSEHGNEAFAHDAQMYHTDAAHMDMDAERRHMEAFRMEQQQDLNRRLSSMKVERLWPTFDIEVVLPPECRLEDEVDDFSLCLNLENVQSHSDRPTDTPPSPPGNSSSSLSSNCAVDIPLHDICSDANSDKPMLDSGSAVNRVAEVNGDSTRSMDNAYGSRPNPYHNNGLGSNHFRGQSHSGNAGDGMNGRKCSGGRDVGPHHGTNAHHVGNANHGGGVHGMGFPPGVSSDLRRDERGMNGSPHYNNYRSDNAGPSHDRGHSRGGQSGASNMSGVLPGNIPHVSPVELHKLLAVLHEQRGLPPPLMPPFAPNGGQGSMNGVPPPFFVHPPPPPGMRMQDMGRGMMMPMMAPPPGVAGGMGLMPPPPITGRMPGRPKSKKKCKYFGTKQGCRDGTSCNFSHDI